MENGISHRDDESLIRQIQEGNHQAFVEIVDRYSKRYYSLSYRLLFCKTDAEDIVQQAFLKLWEKRLVWDENKGAKFTTWFYRVVVNLCMDHNRKKKPVHLAENLGISCQESGQEVLLDEKRKEDLLERLIRELPERQQVALTLCFYEGFSNKEASEIIGIKIKALQSLIMRAKTTLKEKMDKHFN